MALKKLFYRKQKKIEKSFSIEKRGRALCNPLAAAEGPCVGTKHPQHRGELLSVLAQAGLFCCFAFSPISAKPPSSLAVLT